MPDVLAVGPDLQLLTSHRSGGVHYLTHDERRYLPGLIFRTPSPQVAEWIAGQAARGVNVYVSLNPLRAVPEWGRGSAADVVALTALYLDVDYGTAGHSPAALPNPADRDAALALVATLPLRPTGIVHSGGGLYVYHALAEPIFIRTPEDRRRAEHLLGGWNRYAVRHAADQGLHLDNVGDLARILRPVGSWNRKPNRDPRPVEALEWDVDRTVELDEVLALVGPMRPWAPPSGDLQAPRTREDISLARQVAHGVPWAEVLAGWELVGIRPRDGAGLWRHPGSSSGSKFSTITDYAGPGTLICFSSTPGLPVRRRLTKLQVAALLHHAGDYTAAERWATERLASTDPAA